MFGSPAVDGFLRRQFFPVNVNDRRIRRAKFVNVIQRVGVNFLRQRQAVAAGLGQADDFFEPGRAGRFEVQAGIEFFQCPANRRVKGKLVAARMDAELERGRQAVLLDGKGDDGEVFVEFLLELLHIADVIHAFVEAAGEFRRDGLDGNLFVGERGQNDEQFRRRLRAVGFVHRNFGDEICLAFGLGDVPVNFPGVLHGEQIFAGDALDVRAGGFKRPVNVGDDNFAGQFGMTVGKRLHVFGLGGLANRVGHVNGEEIRIGHEAVHRFEPDVIGVQMIRLFPAEFLDRRVRRGAGDGRLGADDGVFAVGLVPDRNNLDALIGDHDARPQLGLGLMRKTVTQAKRKLSQFQKFVHKITGEWFVN